MGSRIGKGAGAFDVLASGRGAGLDCDTLFICIFEREAMHVVDALGCTGGAAEMQSWAAAKAAIASRADAVIPTAPAPPKPPTFALPRGLTSMPLKVLLWRAALEPECFPAGEKMRSDVGGNALLSTAR